MSKTRQSIESDPIDPIDPTTRQTRAELEARLAAAQAWGEALGWELRYHLERAQALQQAWIPKQQEEIRKLQNQGSGVGDRLTPDP